MARSGRGAEGGGPLAALGRWAAGLNILHLAVALAGITALTGVAIPAFYSRPEVTLDHASILLAKDLRYAQNEAAICGAGTRVEFDPGGDGYVVRYESGGPVANPVGGADLFRSYSFDAIFRGVELEVIGGPTAVRFDRDGFALDPLEVELRYGGDHRLLQMSEGSGLVDIQGLENGWNDEGL